MKITRLFQPHTLSNLARWAMEDNIESLSRDLPTDHHHAGDPVYYCWLPLTEGRSVEIRWMRRLFSERRYLVVRRYLVGVRVTRTNAGYVGRGNASVCVTDEIRREIIATVAGMAEGMKAKAEERAQYAQFIARKNAAEAI